VSQICFDTHWSCETENQTEVRLAFGARAKRSSRSHIFPVPLKSQASPLKPRYFGARAKRPSRLQIDPVRLKPRSNDPAARKSKLDGCDGNSNRSTHFAAFAFFAVPISWRSANDSIGNRVAHRPIRRPSARGDKVKPFLRQCTASLSCV
jgi:hypothetical protein